MENVTCEYCHKEYKNKYTLKSHIATNKKCLALRSNKEEKEKEHKEKEDKEKEDKEKEDKEKEVKALFENLKTQPSISKEDKGNKENKEVWACCKECPYTTTTRFEWYQHTLSCLKYQLEEKNKEISKLKAEMNSLVTYIFDIGTTMKNTNYTGKTDSVLFGIKNEPKNKIETEKERDERQEDNRKYVNHICSILCRFRQIQKRHSILTPEQ
jgi:hypothetical protein